MADRRMLAKTITENDNFVALSSASQALYMHLTMSADDDGFCNQVATAMFRAHAKKKDLEALVTARYLLRFENGVMVIKHWRMANSLRKDRHAPTVYQEELRRLTLKDNMAYTMATDCQPDGNQAATMATNWQPDGNQTATQYSIGKDSVGKDRLGKVSVGEDITPATAGNARAPARESEPLPRDHDPTLKQFSMVLAYYQDKINPMPSRICVDALADYTNRLGPEVVIHALGIALDERKTAWSYIDAILRRYVKDGLTNMEAVLQAETAFREEKPAQGGKKVLTFLDV